MSDIRPIMTYADLKLTFDVEPDNNGCAWMQLRRYIGIPTMEVNETFDMTLAEVVALRNVCEAFIMRHEDAQAIDSHVTPAMEKAGSDFLLALTSYAMNIGPLGELTEEEWEGLNIPNKDLVRAYANQEISSVAATYMVMEREKCK
jgi:hypothetical protein